MAERAKRKSSVSSWDLLAEEEKKVRSSSRCRLHPSPAPSSRRVIFGRPAAEELTELSGRYAVESPTSKPSLHETSLQRRPPPIFAAASCGSRRRRPTIQSRGWVKAIRLDGRLGVGQWERYGFFFKLVGAIRFGRVDKPAQARAASGLRTQADDQA
jgi:hypothetical protein